jgi:putative ABC transport system substrate-binding protein
MRRREFIALLIGASALASPRVVVAQGRVRRIGVLMAYAQDNAEGQGYIAAFRDEFQKLGWFEGRNIQIEFRWGATDTAVMRHFAKELVALKPDLIFSSSSPTTRALIRETRAIPIVFGNLVDPIGQGFVASLSKPGGNITGFVNLEASISGKHLELLKEIAPHLTKVAMFYNPATAPYHQIYLVPFKAAATARNVQPLETPFRDLAELEAIMAANAREPNVGQIAMPHGFITANEREIAAMAARHRLPTIYALRGAPAAGGLISYGNDIADNYRRAASYVSRILKGEKPSDLPVQFPVKFHLAINLKAAKALGLDVPLFLQQRADEVIE